MLEELKQGMLPEEIMRRADSGLPKLWVAHRTLTLRRDHPEWFGGDAVYEPLGVTGSKASGAVGFLRAGRVAVVVPRWNLKRGESWAGTTIDIPRGEWRSLLTEEPIEGGRLRLQALLARFPVALLERISE
jgi:(1->4)-alpha-D-glucan 1-alpha-D-glucosylmutase